MRRHLGLLLIALALPLGACRFTGEGSSPINPGLYAIQWQGYIATTEGLDSFARLGFYEVGNQPEQLQLGNPALLTDRGEITTQVVNLSPRNAEARYDLRFATLKLPWMRAGVYRVKELRHSDGKGAEHRVPVGEWLIDVRPPESPIALEDMGFTAQAMSFDGMQVELRNKLPQPVAVQGAYVQLPASRISVEMRATGAPSMATRDESQPVTYPPVIDKVVLQPGAREMTIYFTYSPDDLSAQYPFIQAAPLILYTVEGDSATRYHPLPLQLFVPQQVSDDWVANYILALPRAARLPER